MNRSPLNQLLAHLIDVVRLKSGVFDAHEPISEVMERHKTHFAEVVAFYGARGYRDPFRIAHALLARHLVRQPGLVRKIGTVESTNVFGRRSRCALLERV